MKSVRILAATAAAATLMFGAAQSQAAITTFATINALGGANIEFKNALANNKSASGSLYSIAPSTSVPGSVLVDFSFINEGAILDGAVTNVAAKFTLLATDTGVPAQTAYGQVIQQGLNGGFSLLSTSPITVNHITYAAGSNLLSATFTNADLAGTNNSTSGGIDGNNENAGQTLVYTSDFVSFINVGDEDASFSLSSSLPKLATLHAGVDALETFKGTVGGSFSSDPSPLVNGVPEPATWSMMLIGFGGVGAMMRSARRKQTAVAA